MTRSKVLKAQTLVDGPGSRTLEGGPPFGGQAGGQAEVAPPVGRWITEAALEQLCREWQERGFRQAQDAAQEQAQTAAREAAARELKEQLDQLKSRLNSERAEQMKTLALALAQQLQSLREGLEAQVADWTFVAASRLLGELAPERVRDTVQRLLAESGMDGPVTVLLHPADHALIDGTMAPEPDQRLRWQADAGIERGGCKLVGQQETLDARLEVQLRLLRQALDEAHREARHEPAGSGGASS